MTQMTPNARNTGARRGSSGTAVQGGAAKKVQGDADGRRDGRGPAEYASALIAYSDSRTTWRNLMAKLAIAYVLPADWHTMFEIRTQPSSASCHTIYTYRGDPGEVPARMRSPTRARPGSSRVC